MDFTINCTRVLIPTGTLFEGEPVEIGPAPAIPGLDSDHASLRETNEGASLNPSGRETLDGEDKRPKQLFRCKNYSILSTLNTRTLAPKGRLEELAHSAKFNCIDIIAIQEHRYFHPDDPLQYQNAGAYQLITSSATKNSSNSTIGGVGFLISSKASDNLLNVETISPRIMVLELQGNPKTTLVCVYSPHNDSSLEDMDSFYSDLKSVLESVPQHNILALLGDFNAKLGPEDQKFTYNSETNRNGELLLDLMEEFNLFCSNCSFMKSKNQLWTFEYPSGKRAQLDYILFRKKWRNSIKNSRSYSSFSSIGSDHRIVSSTIKLSLRSSKRAIPHPMKTIDWKKVALDKDLSHQFSVAVNNKFQALYPDIVLEQSNLDESYSHLSKITEEIATELLPKKTKRTSFQPSTANVVEQARENLKRLSAEYHQSPTVLKRVSLKLAKRELDEAYLLAEADFINGKISDIESLHISKQHHAAWKTISEISGKRSKPTIRLKGGSQSKRLSNWTEHFQSLLGTEPKLPENISLPRIKISDKLDISTAEFTLTELCTALNQTKSSKAFGPDNIPPILWKDPVFHDLLLRYCNHTLKHLMCPKIWPKSQIIPFPKKGDLSLATNYRGISLLSIAAKIYNKLILNRLVPKVEPLLRNNQNGFRRGRSTLSQILTLRRIIEECKFCNLDVILIFIDFSKAFDSIDRTTMFEILELYGIPSQIVDAIKVLYTNNSSTILSPDGETPAFDIKAGILQGDTLAPFLFIIVVDYVLRMSLDLSKDKGLEVKPRRSSRHPAEYITDTDFADDISIISSSLQNAQDLLTSLEKAANCVGLYLNVSKTEYMNNSVVADPNFQMKTLNDYILKLVNDYKYLGSYISSSEKDFKTRKGMAWSACNDLHKIWVSNLNTKIKTNIFKTIIEPILLYGSETWTLSVKQQKRLDGTYTRLLMRVKNLSWKQHPTLKQIYNNHPTTLPRVSEVIKHRRVQFAGHCFRATEEVVSPFILWKPKPVGRKTCKLTYPDVIVRDTGIKMAELGIAMKDKKFWGDLVKSILSTAVEE